jgi:hypothetical protein
MAIRKQERLRATRIQLIHHCAGTLSLTTRLIRRTRGLDQSGRITRHSQHRFLSQDYQNTHPF